jgi:transcriptional regulator GlxA family with amidase domain
VNASYRHAKPADTLLIGGGVGYIAAMRDTAMLDWIRLQAQRVDRIGSICTGAMLLATAGLLDGKSVTTHWAFCSRLAALAPRARVDPDALYVRTAFGSKDSTHPGIREAEVDAVNCKEPSVYSAACIAQVT